MATSSIFANIKITKPDKIEAFVDALEASIADPMPPQIHQGKPYSLILMQ